MKPTYFLSSGPHDARRQAHRTSTASRILAAAGVSLLGLLTSPHIMAQHHVSNWVHRNASDSTVVRCRTDSLSMITFPPQSMGMMMPDSFYCRLDRLNPDTLSFRTDSTFLACFGVQAGRDSMSSDMMHPDSGHGHQHMMQFMSGVRCELRWDTTLADSGHHGWHVTGVKAWDGQRWTEVPGAVITGNTAVYASSELHSAIALIGSAEIVNTIGEAGDVPAAALLDQNYPNPFNPTTTVRYQLQVPSAVKLVVYDLLGREVGMLVNETQAPGTHEVTFDAAGLSSGAYVYRLTAPGLVRMRTMLLLK